MFLVRKPSGILEDNDDRFSLVGSSGIPWSHTWGLILSSHSFWPLSIGEGVMGSSVLTRSCRALGTEKLPITRVVSTLVSIYLPNKGVGHSGTTRNWWENLSILVTNKCSGESFSSCFSCSTQNGTGLGGEGSIIGGQDRVSTKKFSDLPATSSCTLGSSRVMVVCDRRAGWSGPLQSY